MSAGEHGKLLRLLETTHAPTLGRVKRQPYWRPPVVPVQDEVREPSFNWTRPKPWPRAHDLVVVDANAGFLSAATSADVAHGALEHTGAVEFDRRAPGYWLVPVQSWPMGEVIASPLGSMDHSKGKMWLTTPTVALLSELSNTGYWPEVDVSDSWTATSRVRLTSWAGCVRDLRTAALDGKLGPDALDEIKLGYSQTWSLIQTGKKSKTYRPDWAATVRTAFAANHWRRSWRCFLAGHGPVGMRKVDEMVFPAQCLAKVAWTCDPPLLPIDQSGRKLGTYKVKEEVTE